MINAQSLLSCLYGARKIRFTVLGARLNVFCVYRPFSVNADHVLRIFRSADQRYRFCTKVWFYWWRWVMPNVLELSNWILEISICQRVELIAFGWLQLLGIAAIPDRFHLN
jgi:hypothetical protein